MTRRSTLVSLALDARGPVRAEFERVREAAYELAAEACRDRMLNRRGMADGIDPYSLFMGSHARAYAYASEELIEHWRTHPRPVFEEFEREQAGITAADLEIDRLRSIIRRAHDAIPAHMDIEAAKILEEM